MAIKIPTSSDADRIAGEGIRVRLKGETHRLRFGMRALRHLEREFGSLQAFIQRLDQKEWGEDRIRAICAGMTAGLLHEKPAEMALEVFQEVIEDLLDDGDSLFEWINSMTLALDQAFPSRRPENAAPKVKGSRSSSLGRATTTSRPRAMAERTRRSGR